MQRWGLFSLSVRHREAFTLGCLLPNQKRYPWSPGHIHVNIPLFTGSVYWQLFPKWEGELLCLDSFFNVLSCSAKWINTECTKHT